MNVSLKDIIPNKNPSQFNLNKIRFKISKKVESYCQCNQRNCLICARKRSSSMLSMKNSIVYDENSPVSKCTVEQPKPIQPFNRSISRQQSNYMGRVSVNVSASTNSTNNYGRTRKTSVESSPPKDNSMIFANPLFSYWQALLQIPLRNWERRLRKSVESRDESQQTGVRIERNDQSKDHI
ncbi:unnamed protein product, partial (macronuclear) [Paramecium tetraurelia]